MKKLCHFNQRACHGKILSGAIKDEKGRLKDVNLCLHHRVMLGVIAKTTAQQYFYEQTKGCCINKYGLMSN